MNIFNSLGFGKLIKTFLPGMIILFSILLIFDTILDKYLLEFDLSKEILTNPILSSILILPLSITLGIFSNIIYFNYFNDILIRNHFNKHNSDFIKAEKEIYSIIKNRKLKAIYPVDARLKEILLMNTDVDYLMIPHVELDKFVFLQESYWYYMEFQLNILLALSILSFGGIFRFISHFSASMFSMVDFGIIVIVASFSFVFVFYLLLTSARLNYKKHRQKLLSYYISIFFNPSVTKRKI